MRSTRTVITFAVLLLLCLSSAFQSSQAQSEANELAGVLKEEIHSPRTSVFQMREFLLRRVAKVAVPSSAEQWTSESRRLREHLLNDVAYHGWPREWVTAPPRFEDVGVIETGNGYRLRKLRYEIVPGFWSAAILYEPERVSGPAPAILNVNGHVGAPGKSVEYKQKRCISFAKQGIFALNLEWFAFGELSGSENLHWMGAHMDLVGTHELGLFLLEMRKGLDYLAAHPRIDPQRLGVTGLSGGGWQTIMLSALDERVRVAVPVAGFSSTSTKVEARERGDMGDIEQSPTDFLKDIDYTHLVALRAPRPTLLIHNAEDNCCFRAPLVKPLIFDAAQPFFSLYGRVEALEWYENRMPGTHNYQLDNRRRAYRFFTKHFNLPITDQELASDDEIKSYDELVVGLPKDNLTILGLARQLAGKISRTAIPPGGEARARWASGEREKLKSVIRYSPVLIDRLWTVSSWKPREVETRSLLFSMNNGLCANAIWAKALRTPPDAPASIILNDKGKRAAAAEISERVNRGEQVLALDLLFTGDAWEGVPSHSFQEVLHGLGERAIGLEVAQLLGIAHWLRGTSGKAPLRLESTGIRSQVAVLVAAALEPGLFSEVVVREGMPGLGYLLDKPVTFQEAGELFCLDLYRDFDLNRIEAIAEPVRVVKRQLLTVAR